MKRTQIARLAPCLSGLVTRPGSFARFSVLRGTCGFPRTISSQQAKNRFNMYENKSAVIGYSLFAGLVAFPLALLISLRLAYEPKAKDPHVRRIIAIAN